MELTRDKMQQAIAKAPGMPGVAKSLGMLAVNAISDKELKLVSALVGKTLDAVKRADIDELRTLLEAIGIPRDLIYDE
jgi:uncharacterized protein (DUF4213/DUF364 family)